MAKPLCRVKICGNTNAVDIQKAAALGADYLGLIFVPGSKRFVSSDQAAELTASAPDFRNFVGVFFNQPREEVEETAKRANLAWLQFQGDET